MFLQRCGRAINPIKRRRVFFHLKLCLVSYILVFAIYGYMNHWNFNHVANDGSYSLTLLPDLYSFNYYLSLNFIVSIDEETLEKEYLNFQRQAQISTPYYPQVLPLSYVIRIDGQPYELEYKLINSPTPLPNLLYVTRKIPFVEHIQKDFPRPNRTIPLLPIPHGQIFDHQNIRRFTLAIRHSDIIDLYIAKFNDNKLLRLQHQPLGLDQMQHHRWLFFSDDDTQQLLAITNIQPHVIVTINENTGIVQEYARTSQPQLFTLLQGEQIFMGAAPIRLPNKDVYLSVFHTSSRTNLFYTFATSYPFEIKCVMLESPFEEKISRRPITEIRLNDDEIFTLELGKISLSKLFDDMQTQCTHKYIPSSSTALQWFPTVIPPSIEMGPFLFNPAVLPLPKGSFYRYLAVSRSNYDAEQHRIIHPSFAKQFTSNFWGIMLACLMGEDFTCVHIPRELHLYYPIEGIAQRYNISSYFPHDMAGAEDPRLLWSETNAPLLLYGMNALESENNSLTTRLVWMIDIRHVFRALNVILPESYAQIPFYTIDQGVELNYRSTLWEKNWMAFIHESRMLIGYSIAPKVTLKRRKNSSIEDSRRWFFDIIAVAQNAVPLYYSEKKYGKILQINKNERISVDPMHQGPNALLIVTDESTFYLTIIHQRASIYDRMKGFHKSFHYMHYTALFDIKAPYRWLKVSRQHIDPILSEQSSVLERDRRFLFVTTIAFNDQVDIGNGYGTLNSRIVVSYGLVDRLSYVWVGSISELMNNMRKVL